MPNCTVSVKLNGTVVKSRAKVPGEDKGRTKHDVALKNLSSEQNTVEVSFDEGRGVLFLWYFELLVQES